MIYLVCSVLASSLIFIIFKLFDRFKINTLQAIVTNYLVAGLCGLVFYKGAKNVSYVLEQSWVWGALALGVLFIIIFNLMAITTQRSGIAVVSVATKMSVVIPILFGLFYYSEVANTYKIIGIVLALVAVYLSSIKKQEGIAIKTKNLLFPLLVFLGSGVIDTSIKFLEDSYVSEADVPLFSSTIFTSAFCIGILTLVYKKTTEHQFRFQFKNFIGGLALGIPNYFSIYFLVKALRVDHLDSSTVFTINNVGIVMLSTLIGIFFFNEKLLRKNWIGILLAIISIALVTLSNA